MNNRTDGSGNPQPNKRSFGKKIAIAVLAIVGIGLAALVIIPLVVDVDKYRPQIVAIVNDHINGKLTIDKMALSLWGQIEIKINGVALTDAAGSRVIAVDETYAQISFMSFLRGNPKLVFRMLKPQVNIVKDTSGKMNVLSLVKPQPPAAEQAPPPSEPTEIPAIAVLAAAGVDVELVDAQLSFVDQVSGFSQKVNDLDVLLEDISMSRPMKLKVAAEIATKVAAALSVTGPLRLHGVIAPNFSGSEFQSANVQFKLELSDLIIEAGDLFRKDKGVPANVEATIVAAKDVVNVENAVITFHNAVLKSAVKLSDLQSVAPTVNFRIDSDPIDLSSWAKLVKMLAPYDLEGRMDIHANANGPTSKLVYDAKVAIQDFVAATPGLLAKPKLQMLLEVVTDQIKTFNLNIEAPGTDLAVVASLQSFTKPKINVDVKSAAIDLDQLLPPPPAAPAPAAGKAEPQVAGGGGDGGTGNAPAGPAADTDAALAPLRENQMLKDAMANVQVRVGKFKGFKIDARNIALDFKMQNLVAAIERFSIDLWQGTIAAGAKIDLKPKAPTYEMNLKVAKVDLKTAIESQVESLRNTMVGKLSFDASGAGRSLNTPQILNNLNLKGRFAINDAAFSSIDVGKMVTEGINSGMQGIVDKIPPLKDQQLVAPKGFSSRYKEVSSDFTLKEGVFLAPNFKTVSYEKQGIDLQGRTEVDLVNDKLDAKWLVVDTYDVTKARDVKVDMSGIKVEKVLSEKNKPVAFPIAVGCKMSAPCYDYKAIPAYFGKIAWANVEGAVGGRVKAEKEKVVAKVKEEVKKQEKEVKKEAKKRAEKELEKQGGKKKLLKGLGL